MAAQCRFGATLFGRVIQSELDEPPMSAAFVLPQRNLVAFVPPPINDTPY